MQLRLRIAAACGLFALGVIWGSVVWVCTRSVLRVRRAVSAVMAGPVCRVMRATVRLQHAERLDGLGPCVLVANHQSLLDHMVLANVYRRIDDFVVVGKLVGKWNIPLVVQLFRLTGNLTVDPARPFRSGLAFKQALDALRAGATVGLYPEGRRRKEEETGQLGRFHRGAFVLAIDAGVPVLPVVVSRYYPRTDFAMGRLLPQDVLVRILPPISTAGLTRADTERLRDLTHARMQAVLDADDAAGLNALPPSMPSSARRRSKAAAAR